MSGLYGQNETKNNIIFIILVFVHLLSFYIYFQSSAFIEIYEKFALGIFTSVLIFGPVLYGLYSQNPKKSVLFSVFAALPFMLMAFTGWNTMIKNGFLNNFYMFVGSYLFSFTVFLITGILTAWLGAAYHSGQIKEIGFGSYKLPVYSLMIIGMLLIFSFLFLITGSMPFGIHLH